MNKDAILATLIGFAIGLTITGIIIVAPTLARSAPKFPKITLPSLSLGKGKSAKAIPTPTIATKNEGAKSFAILVPISDSIVPKNPVSFEGSVGQGATSVLVQSDTDDTVCPVAKDSWSCQITLSEGKNDITVHEIHDSIVASSKRITLFYTAESL